MTNLHLEYPIVRVQKSIEFAYRSRIIVRSLIYKNRKGSGEIPSPYVYEVIVNDHRTKQSFRVSTLLPACSLFCPYRNLSSDPQGYNRNEEWSAGVVG